MEKVIAYILLVSVIGIIFYVLNLSTNNKLHHEK
jgi:hypothetical protein